MDSTNNHQLLVARCKASCKLVLLRCIMVREELGWGRRFGGLGMRLKIFARACIRHGLGFVRCSCSLFLVEVLRHYRMLNKCVSFKRCVTIKYATKCVVGLIYVGLQ